MVKELKVKALNISAAKGSDRTKDLFLFVWPSKTGRT